jgi:hypothetical protein
VRKNIEKNTEHYKKESLSYNKSEQEKQYKLIMLDGIEFNGAIIVKID